MNAQRLCLIIFSLAFSSGFCDKLKDQDLSTQELEMGYIVEKQKEKYFILQ